MRGHGCDVPGLEQMEQNLSLPSGERPDESAGQIEGLQGESNPDSSPLAQQSLVSPSDGTRTGPVRLTEHQTFSESRGEDPLRFLLSDPAPSYLAFLNRFYGNTYKPEHVSLLTGYLRQSMQNQYQSVWSSWVSFVRSNPPVINIEFMISYFKYLFDEKQFSPNTIKAYQAALQEPLCF